MSTNSSLKIVLVGSTGVGKTSLVSSLVNGQFNEYEQPTLGVALRIYSTVVKGTKVNAQIWDTAGQEEYRSLNPHYYRGAQGVIYVYDVKSRKSYEDLTYWIHDVNQISPGVPSYLVANKCDITDQADEVLFDEALEWAQGMHFMFSTASAKRGDNVEMIFNGLIMSCLEDKSVMVTNPRIERAEKRCYC